MLETGFCRHKNSITVLAKNLIVFCLSAIAFWAIGFGLMFGDGTTWTGTSGFFLLSHAENSPTTGENYMGVFKALDWAGLPLSAKFFFQLTFAGTAATIVSGAVAERIKFTAFLLFTPLLVGGSYAITGHWVWGSGWLSKLGFWDFAGSTMVHSVGGWAGLVGTLLLGPRLGKYTEVSPAEFQQLDFKHRSILWPWFGYRKPRKINLLPAENLALSTLGCLILWVGWFGFNAGSTLEANAVATAHILVNTTLAGAMGGIGALIGGWIYFSRPSLAFIINGILGGCVSITASCAYVEAGLAAIIGFFGGLIVIFATVLIDKLLIDDPVGSIPVHLVCGIWGTLAVGLFSVGPNLYPQYGLSLGPEPGLFFGGGWEPLVIQLLGVVAIGLFTIGFGLLAWCAIYGLLGHSIRVPIDQELKGLDDVFDD
jgi:Amt family ammonium transporter